ncbi:MAG: hypothetical protein H6Q12_69 [Bacteroidetes bacterium]|nr:hypothetical protein [Bacteroidota bacterium]
MAKKNPKPSKKEIMKRILLYFLPLFMLLVTSCKDDSLAGGGQLDDADLVNVGVSLQVEGASSVSTRSSSATDVDTTKISNVWVLQFTYSADGTGSLMGVPQYLDGTTDFTSSNMEVKLKAGTSNVYFVANTFNSSTFNSSNCANEGLFKALSKSFTTDSLMQNEFVNTRQRIPMTGKLENFAASATAAPATTVKLTRSAAIVDFTYSVAFPTGQDFDVTGIRVCNVPTKMYYTSQAKALYTTFTQTDFYDYPLETPAGTNTSKTGHIMFYLPENLRNDGPVNTDPYKKTGSDSYCTYVEVSGNSKDGRHAVYRFYVGKDDLKNYEVERNYYYSMNVTLKSLSTTDLRLSAGKIVDGANSYMLLPGQTICIPISWANAAYASRSQAAILPAGKKWTAGLLWTDVPAAVGATGVISSIKADPAGKCIWLTAGSALGNAVIYAKNSDNKTAWSWHIWVTDYVPEINMNGRTYTDSDNQFVWMDRNIGAKKAFPASSVPADIAATFGLQYQWGRKDPFPGGDAVSATTSIAIYDASGTVISNGASGVKNSAGPVTWIVAAQNPDLFYTNSGDWCSTSDNTLWGSPTTGTPLAKSYFDPCPPGWRVPYYNTKYPWNALIASNGVWTTGQGFDWTALGVGYYPAGGKREKSTSAPASVGTEVKYYSATATGTNSFMLGFNSGVISSSNYADRGQFVV